jgi:hypothetical protein
MYKTYNDLKGTETQHLVCWFPLEETKDGDTTKVVDSKGTVGDGTLNNNVSIAAFGASDVYGEDTPRKPRGFDNAPTAQADLIGSGSASFTASNDDYIDIGTDLESWLEGNDKAMTVWVYNGGNTSEARIFNVGYDDSGWATGFGLGIKVSTNNKPFYFLREHSSLNALKVEFGNVMNVGQWYHFAIVQDTSENEAYVYQDGVLEATVSNVGVVSQSTDYTAKIGHHWNPTSGNTPFEGKIAQLGIWDGTLTQEQIQSIKEKSYSELTTSEKTNLVSWWGLDDGGVDTLDNDVTTVLDLNAVYASELMPLFSTDNYRNATSGMVISMDGSEINFARVTTDAYITTDEIVLEASTPYLFEIETGAANNASSSLLNVRMGLFVSGVSSTTYVSTYMAQNTIYRKHFTSAGSNQNAGLGIRINSNNWNINIKSISLKKITSGNMGTLN